MWLLRTAFVLLPWWGFQGGHTPLHVAAEKEHTDCIRELVAAGADVHVASEVGET